ncbi:hypothetical protein JTE90_021574 [Oedothorax gibbosus]|uniref:Transmembrane protein n=1 Tax=Oedothorax gibbosus TaxID=931172 RepID=A0AAV6VRH9_9ARAC|nr:hypothetical protein JTE90_021574 [Oedothorax gibbosus]
MKSNLHSESFASKSFDEKNTRVHSSRKIACTEEGPVGQTCNYGSLEHRQQEIEQIATRSSAAVTCEMKIRCKGGNPSRGHGCKSQLNIEWMRPINFRSLRVIFWGISIIIFICINYTKYFI